MRLWIISTDKYLSKGIIIISIYRYYISCMLNPWHISEFIRKISKILGSTQIIVKIDTKIKSY